MSSLYKIARGMSLGVPEIGETFYVVDTNFRTAAQGWTQSDRTGPLDLYAEKNPGRVFYGAGGGTYSPSNSYATDVLAVQAAVDAAVDFRGDALAFSPGSFSLTTAVALNVPGLRVLGPIVGHPKRSLTTVTDAIGAGYTISVDDVEVAYHTLIPITALDQISGSSGADRGYLHHLYWNTAGIAASTSTQFCAATTGVDWLVENCNFYVDAAQGDTFTLTSCQRWMFQDNDFYVGLTGVAWESVFTFVTSALGMVARWNMFRGCGGSTPATFTNIFTGVANVNGQLMAYQNFIDGTALATASAIETTFGTTTDIELAENYQTGDATLEGGIVIALA
mgnify:CR=1 FL=1